MTYKFVNQVTPLDFFRLSMSRTYRSLVGVCNIVYTVAIFAVTIHFWEAANDIVQVLLIFACMVFIFFQPFGVMMKAKAQAGMIPRDLELLFDDYGLHVSLGDQKEDLGWKRIRLVEERGMLFINSDAKHGYVITNKMLDGRRVEFVEFFKSHIEKYS